MTSSIRICHLWFYHILTFLWIYLDFYSAFRLIRFLILRRTPVCNVGSSCEHITVMTDLSLHSHFDCILLNVIFIDTAVGSFFTFPLCLYWKQRFKRIKQLWNVTGDIFNSSPEVLFRSCCICLDWEVEALWSCEAWKWFWTVKVTRLSLHILLCWWAISTHPSRLTWKEVSLLHWDLETYTSVIKDVWDRRGDGREPQSVYMIYILQIPLNASHRVTLLKIRHDDRRDFS